MFCFSFSFFVSLFLYLARFSELLLITFTGKKGAAMYLLSFFPAGEALVTVEQSATSDYLLGILQWYIGAAPLHCARHCTNKKKSPCPKDLTVWLFIVCITGAPRGPDQKWKVSGCRCCTPAQQRDSPCPGEQCEPGGGTGQSWKVQHMSVCRIRAWVLGMFTLASALALNFLSISGVNLGQLVP